MAVATQVYSGAEFRVAFAEEAVFGTAITLQTAFTEFHVTDITLPDLSGILSDETKRSNGSRTMDATDIFRSNAGSEYTCTVSGVLTNAYLGKLLYGVTQQITAETDSANYPKTFTIDGESIGDSHTPVISFTVNFYNPSTTKHMALRGCVVKTLSITCDPSANGGRATFTATFVSGFTPTLSGLTVTPSSWTAPGVTYYLGQMLQTKTLASSDIVLGKYELTIENGATRLGFDTSGNAQGMAFNAIDCSGSVEIKYDNNTFGLLDKWVLSPTDGSADSDLVLVHGTAGSVGHFSLTLHTVASAVPSLAGSEKGVFQTYGWKAVTESTTDAATFIVTDGINEDWIGA